MHTCSALGGVAAVLHCLPSGCCCTCPPCTPVCIISLRCTARLPACSKESLVEKHTYIMSLQERNERLFYYVLSEVR